MKTKITANLDGLEKWRKQIANEYIARVGVLGSGIHDQKSGLTNATLGLIQLFGSISRNIPARDWLIMPIERQKREIIKAMQGAAARDAFQKGDYKRVMQLLGAAAEAAVHEGFETGGWGQWQDIKESTKRAKKSDKILWHTDQLNRSVISDAARKESGGAIHSINVGPL